MPDAALGSAGVSRGNPPVPRRCARTGGFAGPCRPSATRLGDTRRTRQLGRAHVRPGDGTRGVPRRRRRSDPRHRRPATRVRQRRVDARGPSSTRCQPGSD